MAVAARRGWVGGGKTTLPPCCGELVDGRDEHGRFAPGHAWAGGGQPKKTDAQLFMGALDRVISLPEAASKLAEEVRRGKPWALELYLKYRIGIPAQQVQLSGPNGGPVQTMSVPFDFAAYAKLFDESAVGGDPPAPDGAEQPVDSP